MALVLTRTRTRTRAWTRTGRVSTDRTDLATSVPTTTSGAPLDAGVGGVGQIEGVHTRVDREHNHFEISIAINVGDRRGGHQAIPVVVRIDGHTMQHLAAVVHHHEFADVTAATACPGSENDLAKTIVVDVDHNRLAGVAEPTAGHLNRPRVLLLLIQPEAVQTAIVAREEDFKLAIVVQIGDHRAPDDGFDVLVGRCTGAERHGGPVVVGVGPACAVLVHDKHRDELVGLIVRAIVHVAGENDLIGAVAIHIGHHRAAARKVGTPDVVFRATRAVAKQLESRVRVEADLAPHAVTVVVRGGHRLTVQGVDLHIVNVARCDDLERAAGYHVRERQVVRIDAPRVALSGVLTLRPSAALISIRIQHGHVYVVTTRYAHSYLQRAAVVLQIAHRQRTKLVVERALRPAVQKVAVQIVRTHVALTVCRHHGQLAVAQKIAEHNTGPGSTRYAAVRVAHVRGHFNLPHLITVAIQAIHVIAAHKNGGLCAVLDHRRRGIPTGLTILQFVAKAGGTLPLDGRGILCTHQRTKGQHH
mmetsp:Transcript_18651/g.55880  ORF Transcript_18651/g.55880 Transcript_18651/m.55880 type:complete len:531 (-) Transcript_18651:112-1704(-)